VQVVPQPPQLGLAVVLTQVLLQQDWLEVQTLTLLELLPGQQVLPEVPQAAVVPSALAQQIALLPAHKGLQANPLSVSTQVGLQGSVQGLTLQLP